MSNYPQINIRLRQGADSTHKGPVTRKMFPFDDGIMNRSNAFSKLVLTSSLAMFPKGWLRIAPPQTFFIWFALYYVLFKVRYRSFYPYHSGPFYWIIILPVPLKQTWRLRVTVSHFFMIISWHKDGCIQSLIWGGGGAYWSALSDAEYPIYGWKLSSFIVGMHTLWDAVSAFIYIVK